MLYFYDDCEDDYIDPPDTPTLRHLTDSEGMYAIDQGEFIGTREFLLEEQKEWDVTAPHKYFDFSDYEYWYLDKNHTPEGFDSFDDLTDYIFPEQDRMPLE